MSDPLQPKQQVKPAEVSRTTVQRLRHSYPANMLRIYVVRPVRQLARLLRWISRQSRVMQGNTRRLLVVYDLSNQPISIGDVLLVQAGALVLQEQYGFSQIDFAFAYDTDGDQLNAAFPDVTPANIAAHVSSLLSVVQVNPFFGSLLAFSSKIDLLKFAADNEDRYFVWPGRLAFTLGKYPYLEVLNKLVYPYHKRTGRVPHLRCRHYLQVWASAFFRAHVYPRVPVVVLFRNNKGWGLSRNLDPEIWLTFFEHCRARYPITFVVVCARSEMDPRFRGCPNVVFSKDYGTGIEQDLALIEGAPLMLGSSSGPATMAIFSDKPYFLVNSDIRDWEYRGAVRNGSFVRLPFATEFQTFHTGRESPELLIQEFDRMWSGIEVGKWQDSTTASDSPAAGISWLR